MHAKQSGCCYVRSWGQDRLALAMRELGRIERTLFILDWMQDPSLRGRVQAGLKKGEARNALARAGPRHVVKKGKTPVLSPDETRRILDEIDTTKIVGLRDRALIGVLVFAFARISAAVAMKVADVFIQNDRLWVRLHEKGRKHHTMPCQHYLETYLKAYLEASGRAGQPKRPLFPTLGRSSEHTNTPLSRRNALDMVKRRARQAGVKTTICNHSFRGTGITTYLENGGELEKAAQMANHSSTRTTQLYDRRADEVTLDEVERIII